MVFQIRSNTSELSSSGIRTYMPLLVAKNGLTPNSASSSDVAMACAWKNSTSNDLQRYSPLSNAHRMYPHHPNRVRVIRKRVKRRVLSGRRFTNRTGDPRRRDRYVPLRWATRPVASMQEAPPSFDRALRVRWLVLWAMSSRYLKPKPEMKRAASWRRSLMRPCSARANARLSRFTTNSSAAKLMNISMMSSDLTTKMNDAATARHPSIRRSTLANLKRNPTGNDRRAVRPEEMSDRSCAIPCWMLASSEDRERVVNDRRPMVIRPPEETSMSGDFWVLARSDDDDSVVLLLSSGSFVIGSVFSSLFMTTMASGALNKLFIATITSTLLNTAIKMAHACAILICTLTDAGAGTCRGFWGWLVSIRLLSKRP
mmetsp:Transcript_13863/g.29576  ORF Transcript_13863/g.29576 Transcript_13863/m.29576 type:complete len:371 (-) Transcript_13863:468-1580(-)